MKRLLSVTFFSGLLTLVRMGNGFIIAKLLAVYAGPSGMALLGQVQSIVASVNGIVNTPVSNGVVRFTAEFSAEGVEKCSPWWRASLWWLAVILCAVMPLGLLFAQPIAQLVLHSTEYAWIISVTTFLLPLAAIGTLLNSIINGYQCYRRYIVAGMLSSLLSCMIMIIMIMTQGIYGALLAAAVQSSLVGVVILVTVCRLPWCRLRYFVGPTGSDYKKKIGEYILMALASALAVPIAMISVRNILIVNVGWAQAGQWQAVWKISEAYLSVITLALGTYYFPKLASLKGTALIRQEINQAALVFIPLVTLLALAIYLLRDIIIPLLFTEAFTAARDLFSLQLIGDIIKITGWLYAYPMMCSGATTWFVSTEIIFSSTLVLLSSLLVPVYLSQGANLAYLLNYIVYFLFTFMSLRYYVK